MMSWKFLQNVGTARENTKNTHTLFKKVAASIATA